MHSFRLRPWTALSSIFLATACGAEDDARSGVELPSAPLEQALGESGCYLLTTPVDVVLPESRDGVISPTTYDNPQCRKSRILGIPGLAPAGLDVAVQWTDPWRRNRAQCEGGSLTISIMSRSTAFPALAFYRSEGTYSMPLWWDGHSCLYPTFNFWDAGSRTLARWVYVDPWGRLVAPPDPSQSSFELKPYSFAGRDVRFAVQALTPAGSTQSVRAAFIID